MSKEVTPANVENIEFHVTPLQQALASCTGAIITSFFVTPLDVVKIRLQAQQKTMGKCFLYCNGLMDHICSCPGDPNSKQWYQRPSHFNGTVDAFLKISRTEGITSLWSGLSPTLVSAIPATIAYFVSYEQLRLSFKEKYNRNKLPGEPLTQPFWIPLICGASARLISATVVSPLELIRTKMQSKKLTYLELEEALRILIRQDGVIGLWRGVFPTLLRDVPFSAIYWMHYEFFKQFYKSDVPSFGYSFLCGAAAGSIAATLTTPFDVVKTHQQIEIGELGLENKPMKTRSTAVIIRSIYAHHGLKGLFAGLLPRLIKVAPACAMMIATFEHGKVWFNRLANKKFYSSDVNNVSSNAISTSATSKSCKPKDGLIRELKQDLLQ